MLEEEVKKLEIPGIRGVIDHPAVYAQLKGKNGIPFLGRKFSARTSLEDEILGLIMITYRHGSGCHIFARSSADKASNFGVVNLVRPVIY
jgi:hypothetical protein